MPRRKVQITNDNYYHIFNRGVAKTDIFLDELDYKRFLITVKYYSYKQKHSLQYHLQNNSLPASNDVPLCEVISYVLMPNHFHLILKQREDSGISECLSKLQNSHTKYFNTKHTRIGPLFQGPYKAISINDETYLLHLNRYLHLNPYSSSVVKSIDDLLNYEWSSLREYVGLGSNNFCKKGVVLSHFPNNKHYKDFVISHANYQRALEQYK